MSRDLIDIGSLPTGSHNSVRGVGAKSALPYLLRAVKVEAMPQNAVGEMMHLSDKHSMYAMLLVLSTFGKSKKKTSLVGRRNDTWAGRMQS